MSGLADAERAQLNSSWASEADTKAKQSRRSINRFLNHERYKYVNDNELIERLIPSLCDREFLSSLESHRGKGRNDYPIELLWRGMLASIALCATSIAQMRRKMKLWPQLFSKIPTTFSFSRFFSFLCRFSSETEVLLFRKVHDLPLSCGRVVGIHNLGRIFFLFDPQYELPIIFDLQEDGVSPIDMAEKLLARFSFLNSEFSQRCKYFLATSEYEGIIKIAWERYKIRALVPRKDSLNQIHSFRDAYYDEKGMVYCGVNRDRKPMVYAGFEEKRNSLKYRCMARHYGTKCEKLATCSLRSGIRIPIAVDERIFSPLPRTSYRWGQIYSLFKSKDKVIQNIEPYLHLANNDEKKLLCCRLATLLIHGQKMSQNAS